MSTVKKFGAWNIVANQLKKQSIHIKVAVDKGFTKVALTGERIVLEHIQNQDLDWEPLQETYREKKRKQAYSDSIYVKTGSYFNEIKGWHDRKRVYVGIPKGAINSDGNSLETIGQTLEYGSNKLNIPPRPLMEPSMEETKAEAHKIMKAVLKEVLGL